jgi:C-terminal peptidase prc
MTKGKLTGLVTSLVLALASVLPARAEEPTTKTYLVLVGVSQYGDKQIKPRPHAEDDAKALYDVFTNKDYRGVDPANVHLLLGNADPGRHSQPATHENVIQALHSVVKKAERDDLVIFAYFGQGATLNEAGSRLGYFASDSTVKDRAKNAVAAADIQQELDKLKSQRFCAFIDVSFKGIVSGPEKVAEPVLGAGAYREFLGADGKESVTGEKEDQSVAPGRVLFLASGGIRQSIDLEKHGLFAHIVVQGLKGAADKEGFEPDGLVTVDELGDYLDKQAQELSPRYGRSDEEKRPTVRFYESRSSHFELTHNPAVIARVKERIQKLARLAKDEKIGPDIAAEGKNLLGRMPKLKSQQALRREYQRLVDGKLTVEEFTRERDKVLASSRLKRSAADAFAAKVIHSTQIIQENYVKDVNQAELVAWAIRGLYRQLEEKMPTAIRERLDKVRGMSEPELTKLLADVRVHLGLRDDLESHKDIDIALQRMLAHLDPYTTYYDPETLARFQQETSGQFRGIGVQIRQDSARGALQVVTPLKGSPAYRAGVLAGDYILSIIREVDKDGKPLEDPEVISTKGMTTSDAVKQIQGKPGSKVKLVIERKGVEKPLEIEVKRELIEVETVTGITRKTDDNWEYYLDRANKIAYVRVTTFARRTSRDVLRVLNQLKSSGVNGFILDLRFNPGGLLTSAVEISDMFIDDGLIVTIRSRSGKEVPYPGNSEGSFLNFPMVCLVNGMSASGSEIVSACLQDHERAIVIGERSYGKGSVQNIQPFEGGELKFTTASFWRPSGKNLNKSSTGGKDDEDWGVLPNPGFEVKLSEKEREQLYEHQHDSEIIPRRDLPAKAKKTEFKDRQLEMAVEYLRGQIRTAAKATAKRAG